MGRRGENSAKAPTQRQLRVGEEVRHALAEVFMRGEMHMRELDRVSITVSEVRIGPDLKNATAYITTLGGAADEETVKLLNKVTSQIRKLVGKRVHLKYVPKIYFKIDKSFEFAGRVNALLNQPEVKKDVIAPTEEGDETTL